VTRQEAPPSRGSALDGVTADSLEGDVGEQRGGGEDGGDAAADVGDEGQDPVVLRVDVGRRSGNVLRAETRDGGGQRSEGVAGRRRERVSPSGCRSASGGRTDTRSGCCWSRPRPGSRPRSSLRPRLVAAQRYYTQGTGSDPSVTGSGCADSPFMSKSQNMQTGFRCVCEGSESQRNNIIHL